MNQNELPVRELIEAAISVRKKAYAPYSEFKVGAALLTSDDRIYTGCNVENAAYGPSNCAERTAIFKAVSEGKQRFQAIAVVGGKEDIREFVYPCGTCRQVLCEFTHPESFRIIVAVSPEEYRIYTLAQLLPEAFTPVMLRDHNHMS